MLTAKEIILEIKFYANQLKRFWYILLIAFGLGTSYSYYKQSQEKPSFSATKTFMVADDEGASGIGTFLGQFGFGGGGGAQSNYEKIRQIGLSNLIINRMLFDSAVIDSKEDLLVHHVLEAFDIRNDYENDDYRTFQFEAKKENISLVGNSILKNVVNRLRGDINSPTSGGIIQIIPNAESTILELVVSTPNSELSILLAESLFYHLSDFYIKKSIESNQKTYESLSQKADSIGRLLAGSEVSMARSSDYARGLVLNKDRTAYARSTRNIELYAAMYGEVLKNRETAQFMLNSKTPYFQEIDSPYLPLSNTNTFSSMKILLFGLIPAILAALVVLASAYYKKEIKVLLE